MKRLSNFEISFELMAVLKSSQTVFSWATSWANDLELKECFYNLIWQLLLILGATDDEKEFLEAMEGEPCPSPLALLPFECKRIRAHGNQDLVGKTGFASYTKLTAKATQEFTSFMRDNI